MLAASSAVLAVDGKANIYAAGYTVPAAPPSPGGGGGGVYPTTVQLKDLGNPDKVTFPTATGTVSGWAARGGFNGADGGHFWGGVTNVPAWGGISGVRHSNATMFLVGVFLGASGQPVTAPATTDVTNADSGVVSAPQLGQQFFVGDGHTIAGILQSVVVPAGAATLSLGFAEVWGFSNPARRPGFYNDNGGSLSVKVEAAARPDLTVSLGKLTAAKPGESVTVDATIKNAVGVASANANVITRFRLSTDAKYDESDTLLADAETALNLNAGATVSASATFELPKDAKSGTYYIVAKTDYKATVSETVESNNTAVSAAFEISPLRISSVSSNTFIATDTITLKADGAEPGATVKWTITGGDAAAGIKGFAADVSTVADADGVATFEFKPSANTTFVKNRRDKWTVGSLSANPSVSFDVVAKATIDGKIEQSRLSATKLGRLVQDEKDRLRQEYYDYGIPVPSRDSLVPKIEGGYSQSAYGFQLSVGLVSKFSSVVDAYCGRAITVTVDGKKYKSTIPKTATLILESGYRNPQRNKKIGSKFPDSKHTRGQALDLIPNPVTIDIVIGKVTRSISVPLHSVLYPALQAAGATVGTAIAEMSAIPVPLGDSRENHIHVQWDA